MVKHTYHCLAWYFVLSIQMQSSLARYHSQALFGQTPQVLIDQTPIFPHHIHRLSIAKKIPKADLLKAGSCIYIRAQLENTSPYCQAHLNILEILSISHPF